jgi:hypothetical protein
VRGKGWDGFVRLSSGTWAPCEVGLVLVLCSFDECALQGGSERGMFACVSEEDEHAAADSAVQDQWS